MSAANFWSRGRSWLRRAAALRLARRPLMMRNTAPLISFTFDDFPRSALHAGGTILERHGVRGTYYVSLGLVGQHAPTGEMFWQDDLQQTVERGHELGCHTFAHCDSSLTAPREFEASVRENRQALAGLVCNASLATLSYPINTPRVGTKRRCARHFQGCRAGGQRMNAGVVDLNYLQAFFIEQSRHRMDAIFNLIAENTRRSGWLIFATHDVAEAPTRFGCTPPEFESIVEHSVRSGARVLPVGEALRVAGGAH